MNLKWLCAALFVPLAFCSANDTFDFIDKHEINQFASAQNSFSGAARWEFGLDAGGQFFAHKAPLSVRINNDALTIAELNEEFEENGLPGVGPGFSTVSGNIRSSWEFGFHLLYQVVPMVSLGIEGGYGLDSGTDITNPGVYVAPLFSVDYNRGIYHTEPIIKVGRWFGAFRPYGSAGIGWYEIRQRAVVTITDPFDPEGEPPPVTIFNRTDDYLGTTFGGGVDVHVGGGGTIGFDLRYHRIFNPGSNVEFFSPGLRFSYIF